MGRSKRKSAKPLIEASSDDASENETDTFTAALLKQAEVDEKLQKQQQQKPRDHQEREKTTSKSKQDTGGRDGGRDDSSSCDGEDSGGEVVMDEAARRKAAAAKKKAKAKKKNAKEKKLIAKEYAAAGPLGLSKTEENAAVAAQLDGLRLRAVDVPADGNCLFAAVAQQMGLHSRTHAASSTSDAESSPLAATSATPEEVRLAVCDQIYDHWDDPVSDYGSAVLAEAISSGGGDSLSSATAVASSKEEYCARLRKGEVWGGLVELRAIVDLYGVPIRVIMADRVQNIDVVVSSARGSGSGPQEGTFWTVVFYQHKFSLGAHYDGTAATKST